MIYIIFLYIDSMIGDVNLYINDQDDPKASEIEIMIAGNKKIILLIFRLSCSAVLNFNLIS